MEGFTQRQTIELTQSNPVLVRDQPLVKGDVQALVWIVTIKKNGVPVDLAGATASLYCARALSEDGSGGTTYSAATIESGGAVKAVLPTDAANIPGPVGCMIRVTRDGASVAVARMAVMAIDQTGDDILDEGKRIPSLDEIMASIARCDAAAEKAEGAAASVGDALKQVASAIEAANGATSDARNAAGQATDGASAAKAAANTATEAATKINDMTISATGLAAGAAPTAELTEVDGHYNIVLGLPKGDKGDPGATPQITVQVKTGEPGTAASVKQTGTAEAPVIELTIPRGDTGSIGSLTINGKAPDSAGKVELTAADVGARADDWMPTAADVGALSGTDATLTEAGKAADAKATGNALNQLKTDKVAYTDVLTLEEIEASTNLDNKAASAGAAKELVNRLGYIKHVAEFTLDTNQATSFILPSNYHIYILIAGHIVFGSNNGMYMLIYYNDSYAVKTIPLSGDWSAEITGYVNGKVQITTNNNAGCRGDVYMVAHTV